MDAAVWEQVGSGRATFLVRLRGPFPWEKGAGAGRLPPETIVSSGRERIRRLAHTLADLERAGHVTRKEEFPASRTVAVFGDLTAVRVLAADPAVEEVRPDAVRTLPDAARPPSAGARAVGPLAAGLLVREPGSSSPRQEAGAVIAPQLVPIRAPEAWSKLGVTGEGMVIAVIDTGVDWTHTGLLPGYRGRDGDHDYDWFDATGGGRELPADDNGHGTFVAGLAVGSDPEVQTGVAPGAEWIAVKSFDRNGRGRDSWLLRAAEWVLAPTDKYGARPRPDLAPDIVNASWVLENGVDPLLRPAVAAWRAAGIVAVFAAGNDEAGLGQNGTVLAPASYPESIGVGGATGDAVWGLSMGGPSFYGGLAPLLLAPIPGQSTMRGGGFGVGTGTSAAAPLVSGTAALMRAANPDLTPDDVVRLLGSSARDIGPTGPDPLHGFGLLDAHDALRRALFSGRAAGSVALADGTPANVALHFDPVGDGRWAPFDVKAPDGQFDVALQEGEWVVSYGGFALAPASTHLFASSGVTTRLALTANPVPLERVMGGVRDELGRGIAAARVERLESAARAVTDENGAYVLALPAGRHVLAASATGRRTMTATIEIAPGGDVAGSGETTAAPDFTLQVAPTIAVVDADADLDERIYPYIERSLNQLGYPFTVWTMEPEAGGAWPPFRADVLMWTHHAGSPGRLDQRVGGWVIPALTDYAQSGGRLLISGQNIAELDAGDGPSPAAPEFIRDMLRADYVWGNAGSVPVAGRGPLAGVSVRFESPDAYRWGQSLSPDSVTPSAEQGDPAELVMAYPNGLGAAVASAGALGRRLFLSFALHGAGPEDGRALLVERGIGWLASPDVSLQLDPAKPSPGKGARLSVYVFGGHASADAALRVLLPPALVPTATGGGLVPVPGGAEWSGTLGIQPREFTIDVAVAPASGALDLEAAAELTADQRTTRRAVAFRVDAAGFDSSALLVSPARLQAGEEADTSLVITNAGSAAGPVNAALAIPPGLEVMPERVAATRGEPTVDGALVRWAGEVSAGESVTVTAGVIADATEEQPQLRATLTSPSAVVDLPPPDMLVGGPDLQTNLALWPPILEGGATVTATLDITNTGPTGADVRATLRPPAGVGASGPETWRGLVDANAHVAVAWSLQVVSATTGSYVVTADSTDGLAPPLVESAAAPLRVRTADLARSRAVFEPAEALTGEILHGVVDLVNDGDAPADAVTTVVLPGGLTTNTEWITVTAGTVTNTLGSITWRANVPPGVSGQSLRYGALIGRSLGPNTTVTVPHVVVYPTGRLEMPASAILNRVGLAESTLDAAPSARAAGGRIDYSLAVRASGPAAPGAVDALISLPPGLALIEGTLSDGLAAGAMSTLVWRGELAAGEMRTLRWAATLNHDLSPGGQAIVLVRLRADGVPTEHLASRVEVTDADLTASTKLMRPAVASRGDSILVVLRAVNGGTEPLVTTVTDALPAGLAFEEGSLWASHGIAEWDPASGSIRWRGEIAGRESVEVRFEAEYITGEEVRNVMVVADDSGTRVSSWAAVAPLRDRLYIPAAARP